MYWFYIPLALFFCAPELLNLPKVDYPAAVRKIERFFPEVTGSLHGFYRDLVLVNHNVSWPG
jgi:hypothetical protein